MRRIPRWLLFTAAVVVIALGAVSSVAVATARQSFPQLSGELSVAGLSASVEVLRDEHGVPQIYADNAEDLFAAQGFVHAQDRFYEMDVRRHITAGRLSELFGASQVETDTYIRTLGWRRVAEEEVGLLSATTRRYLDAYASGVNAYLRSASPGQLSLEYSVLGLQGRGGRPEEWSAVDSLSWLKAMAWSLGSNMDQEAERAVLTAGVGRQRTADVMPAYPLDGFDPIVAAGAVKDGTFDPSVKATSRRPAPLPAAVTDDPAAQAALASVVRARSVIPRVLGDTRTGAIGSNSWVVSGSRTATGKPILSNDPHLATAIPSVFAQVGLHCRTLTAACPYDVSGFSFSGVPGVVIGKNTRIAWGLTTSNVDVQDLYLEQVQGDTVKVGSTFTPLQVRTEEITVAGEESPRTITIRSSRHGPLLSDVDTALAGVGAGAAGEGRTGYAVSLAWTALTPGRTMDALFSLDRATNFTQFRAAAKLLAAPSQNLVYADVDGNIGYQLPGAIPARGKGDGLQLNPGWDTAYDWKGLVPFEELPYVENPAAGFIVTANNQIIGDQYTRRLGTDYSYGWRSQQIIDALEDTTRLSVATSADLQRDDTLRFAADLVPTLLKIKVHDPWIAEGQQTLVGWDYGTGADSAAAAYFAIVVHDILKRTFRDQMPEDLWPSTGDRWYAVLSTLVKQPNNPWWDDVSTPNVIERRDDILLAAMTDARKEATSLMSRETSGWSWGRLHTVTLRNETLGKSGIAPIERIFNRGRIPVPGGSAVVDAMGFDDATDYTVTSGPTMRMTVDLSDLDASVWVNQSGASGHAFHPNYADQLPLWAAGQTWPFVSSRSAVEGRTTNTLVLRPGG